jgi:hypothetical protein
MRKFGIVLGTIVLSIIGFVALVFMATSGLADSADDFFVLVSQGELETAYESTHSEFRVYTNYPNFESFMLGSGLVDYTDSTWNSRSFEDNLGTVSGTVVIDDGTIIPLRIDLIKESGEWQIYGIEINPIN